MTPETIAKIEALAEAAERAEIEFEGLENYEPVEKWKRKSTASRVEWRKSFEVARAKSIAAKRALDLAVEPWVPVGMVTGGGRGMLGGPIQSIMTDD